MWDEIWATVRAELSDLPDAAGATRVVMRLMLSVLLGGVLGWERERRGKAAGLRTYILVTMGAALFVLVPREMGTQLGDMTRVYQGLITGIGFLGAGAIVKGNGNGDQKSEAHVHGLTTAAGIWMAAAIGITIGLGREMTAILSTLFALIVLAFLPHLETKEQKPRQLE